MALLDHTPGPLLRAFLRAPTWLYRARLGWLLGNRFLYMVHRGRRTGKARYTVVEVIRFDRDLPEVFAIAGWGPHTQWYENLRAAPAAKVRFGRHHWPRPEQRFPGQEEREELLSAYAREHPRAARELGRAFGATELNEKEIARLAMRTRAVAFRPAPNR